jgi:hypothetical protein
MLIFWQFTVRILFILAIVSLPAVNFFTGSDLAGNLASFVLVLLVMVLLIGLFQTAGDSRKAVSGELVGEKLEKFMKAHRPREGIEKTLFSLSRAAWVVSLFVMAACGYEWFAGFILVIWLLYMAAVSLARDSVEVISSKTQQVV